MQPDSKHRFLNSFQFGLIAFSGLLLNNSLHAKEPKKPNLLGIDKNTGLIDG
jgi:hypothetical protein